MKAPAPALDHYQRLAAGQLLQDLAGRDDVVGIEVDGKAVIDQEGALAAFRDNRAPAPSKLTAWIDAKAARVASSLEKKMEGDGRLARLGRKVLDSDVFEVNPERVAYAAETTITFRDGRTERRTVEVEDVKASLALERLAISSLALSAIPFMPMFVSAPASAAGAVVSSAGWLVATLARKSALASAFAKTALKLFAFGVAGMAPILGSLPCAASLISDARDIKRLNAESPTVGDMLSLGQHGAEAAALS